jgi:hypothetical protein
VTANAILNNPITLSLSEVSDLTLKIRLLLRELRSMKVGEADRPLVAQEIKKAREAIKFSQVTLGKAENKESEKGEANVLLALEKLRVVRRDLDNRKKTILSRPIQ